MPHNHEDLAGNLPLHKQPDSHDNQKTMDNNNNRSKRSTLLTLPLQNDSSSEEDIETASDDYANHPPPIPSPNSPSYSYYLEAVDELRNSTYTDLQALNTDTLDRSARGSVSSANMRRRSHGRPPHGALNSISTVNDVLDLGEYNVSRISSFTGLSELDSPTLNRRSFTRIGSGTSLNSLEESSNSHVNTGPEADNNSMKYLKQMVFSFLNPRQHLALAMCRDLPLWLCLYYMCKFFYEAYQIQYGQANVITQNSQQQQNKNDFYSEIVLANLLTTRSSEYLITGMWCFVSAFMVYSILDGLIVRWIVIYSVSAAMVRMLSMSVLLVSSIRLTIFICTPNDNYLLHTWIFLACGLTVGFIIQNFFVHDLDYKIISKGVGNDETLELNTLTQEQSEIIETRSGSFISNILNGRLGFRSRKLSRYFNYYNIIIYAVMPIGVASFITMIVLLRNILILKLDIETIYKP